MRRILLAEEAWGELIDAARSADPYETGGVLLGVRAGRDPWVTTIAHVTSAHPASSRYVLPQGATTAAVDAARAGDPRVGYLGEWHSHPSGGGPSAIDRGVMRTLGWFLPFPQPILIIVATEPEGHVLRGYASRVLILVRADVVATGPLPLP